jgi:hypothetical protein
VRTYRHVITFMSRHRDRSRLCGVNVLPMAAARAVEDPFVFLNSLYDITNLYTLREAFRKPRIYAPYPSFALGARPLQVI